MRIYLDYPNLYRVFETDETFPPFDQYCERRNEVMRRYLESKPELLDGIPHIPSEFAIEAVRKTKKGERWILGS